VFDAFRAIVAALERLFWTARAIYGIMLALAAGPQINQASRLEPAEAPCGSWIKQLKRRCFAPLDTT
jgi:hypothetical protein